MICRSAGDGQDPSWGRNQLTDAKQAGYLSRMSAPRATWVPAVLVTLASAGLGGMSGVLSSWFYPHQLAAGVGLPLGGLLGLAVGAAWVGWMRWKAGANARVSVVGWGTLGGLVSGSVQALVLHAGMSPFFPQPFWFWLHDQRIAQVFGVAVEEPWVSSAASPGTPRSDSQREPNPCRREWSRQDNHESRGAAGLCHLTAPRGTGTAQAA